MDNIRLLEKYVEILDYGKHTTDRENEIYYSVENNPELAPIAKEIKETFGREERLAIVKKYASKLKEMNYKSELEQIKGACEKAFGIELDNIEFKKLKYGRDIIAFHDPHFGRKRLIDYSYAKSLIGNFTDVQNSNEAFQTDDYEKNANNIAKAEAAENTNRELNMIEIEKFKTNYSEVMSRIPANEQYKVAMINKLLNQAEDRGYRYINIENMVALDNKGTIVEASLTQDNEVQVTEAADYKREVSSLDNQGNAVYNNNTIITNTSVETNTEGITPTPFEQKEVLVEPDDNSPEADFKKIVAEEMEKHNIQGSVDVEYNKVKNYSGNPDKLEHDQESGLINDNQYEFYKELSEKYVETNKVEKSNTNTRTLTYTSNEQSGFTTALLIAIVAIAIGLIVVILLNL